MSSSSRLVGSITLGLLAGGCHAPPPASTADAVVHELFVIAGETQRPVDELRLHRIFDMDPGSDTGELLDELSLLAEFEASRILGEEPHPGRQSTAVDVEARLPGGGSARYSVHLVRSADGDWRVHWFAGPGVEWPRSRTRGDSGLSTSSPPSGPGSLSKRSSMVD